MVLNVLSQTFVLFDVCLLNTDHQEENYRAVCFRKLHLSNILVLDI